LDHGLDPQREAAQAADPYQLDQSRSSVRCATATDDPLGATITSHIVYPAIVRAEMRTQSLRHLLNILCTKGLPALAKISVPNSGPKKRARGYDAGTGTLPETLQLTLCRFALLDGGTHAGQVVNHRRDQPERTKPVISRLRLS